MLSWLTTLPNLTLTSSLSYIHLQGTQLRIKDKRKLRSKVLELSERRKKGIKNLLVAFSFSLPSQSKRAQRSEPPAPTES